MSSLNNLIKSLEFAKSKGDHKRVEELGQLYLNALQGLADDALSRGRSREGQAYLTEKVRFEKEDHEPRATDFETMGEYISAVERSRGLQRPTPTPEEERRDTWKKFDAEMSLKFGGSWTNDSTRREIKKEVEK